LLHADGAVGLTNGHFEADRFRGFRKHPTMNTCVLVIPQCWLQIGVLPKRSYIYIYQTIRRHPTIPVIF